MVASLTRLTIGFWFVLVTAIAPLMAVEMMHPLAQRQAAGIGSAVYANTHKDNLRLEMGGASLILVPLAGGGTAQFFSDAVINIDFEGDGTDKMFSVMGKPHKGLIYTVSLGAGTYEIEIPSSSATNRMRSDDPGFIWGAGIRWLMLPETMVSPAVSLDVQVKQSRYTLSRLWSGNSVPVNVNYRFSRDEYQAGFSLSKRWSNPRFRPSGAGLETYGGVRVLRQKSNLRDKINAGSIGGTQDVFSEFLGFSWEFYPNESLVLETAFGDQKGVGIGLSLGFGE